MANIRRIEVLWSGTTGLPGITVFHSLDSVSGALAAIRACFNSWKTEVPTGINWSFPGTGDVLDSATGTLVGGWTDTQPADVASSGSGYHAAGVGVIVTWHTGAIVGGRRLKGRTFLCPITSAAFETNGTVVAGTLSTIKTAGDTLWGTGTLNVWHRPTAPGASNGSVSVVTSCTVKDQVTRLSSRTI